MRHRTFEDQIDVQRITNATVREHVLMLDGARAPAVIVQRKPITVKSTSLSTSRELTDAPGATNVQAREPALMVDGAKAKVSARTKKFQSTRNALLTKPKTPEDQTNATTTANALEQDTAHQVDDAPVMVVTAQRHSKRSPSMATPAKSTRLPTSLEQTDATILLNALEREPAPALDGAQVNLTAELNIIITCSYLNPESKIFKKRL